MAKIVGKQAVDYVSKKTDKQVTGVTLYLTLPNDGVDGLATDKVFISGKSAVYPDALKMPIGAEILVMYNRYGSVEYLQRTDK